VKILITTLFMLTCIKQSTFCFDSNNCQLIIFVKISRSNFKRIVPDEYITYLQVMGRLVVVGRIVAIAAIPQLT